MAPCRAGHAHSAGVISSAAGAIINVSLQSTDLPSRIPSSMKWRTRAHWVVVIRNERHAQGTVSYDLRGSYLDLQKRP